MHMKQFFFLILIELSSKYHFIEAKIFTEPEIFTKQQ